MFKQAETFWDFVNTLVLPKPVLASGNSFSLLACANVLTLPTAEIASLTSPIFYQDDEYTFFVEPTLTETTTDGSSPPIFADPFEKLRA